jgi:hypothetical protein
MEIRKAKDARGRTDRRPARLHGDAHGRALRVRVEVLENSLASENPALGREAEREALALLEREDMPGVVVRFRACRDDQDRMRFICKVEYAGDGAARLPWRWWSPLLTTPSDLRDSLREGLAVRRLREAEAFAAPWLPNGRSRARVRSR